MFSDTSPTHATHGKFDDFVRNFSNLEVVLSALSEMVQIVDAQTLKVDYTSKSVLELLGYTNEQILVFGQGWQEKLAAFTDLSVTIKENAQKKDYTQTIVVDLNGQLNKLATDIATSLGGSVATLPEGEQKPNTDLLVIAAK